MSSRVSFADLLKAGADKDKQRATLKLAAPAPSVPKPIAPERDFNKRANSLERDALPNRLFSGAGKAIYDALYVRTLGAINPTNTIQATRKQIINWSGVKNIKTVNIHLKKLEENGLIKRSNFVGEQSGNYYEICLPVNEDSATQISTNYPDQTGTRPRPDPDRFSDPDQDRKSVWVGSGKLIENKATYDFPNTSLKTFKKTDDEPAARSTSPDATPALPALSREGSKNPPREEGLGTLEKVVDEMSKKVIGKGLKSTDGENLKELAELLKMEFEIAVARAGTISNVPAFLTEHLRRRFLGKHDADTKPEVPRTKPVRSSLRVGQTVDSIQTDTEKYQAEPLTQKAREVVLKTMLEYVEKGQSEFVTNLQNTYTAEDWRWLTKNLPDEAFQNNRNRRQKSSKNKNSDGSNTEA